MAKCKTAKKAARRRRITKISRLRKPEDMQLEQWQIALRKQFAEKQDFRLKNIGDEPVFSEFIVANPATGQPHLKLPIPKRETLQNIANLLNEFLAKPPAFPLSRE